MEEKGRDTTEHKSTVADAVPPVASKQFFSKTKWCLLIAAASILGMSWWATNRVPAWVHSFNASPTFSVYEGLPRPGWETEFFQQEKQRSDIAMIDGFDFYTPSIAVNEKQLSEFKEILGDNGLYYIPDELKDCGFHPDFAVEWTDSGRRYRLLICFTCNDAEIRSEDWREFYSLKGTSEIESLLSEYSIKRPRGPEHFLGESQ